MMATQAFCPIAIRALQKDVEVLEAIHYDVRPDQAISNIREAALAVLDLVNAWSDPKLCEKAYGLYNRAMDL